MRKAIKLLNGVASVGFDLKKPEDQEKRSSLIRGLFMNKYDRAKLSLAQKESKNVQTEKRPAGTP